MKNATLRQLKVFEAVARLLSFSRAAEELHLTQPAVSTQIRKLEEHAGLPLFEQFGKKIYLTPAGAEKVGKHKTSMLQDVEAGRAPEIDALVGAVVELARLTETPTPHIDTVYSLVKLLARTMEDQRGRVRLHEMA